ncbi:MAG: ribonuclease III [Gammaproteobacteria bacterium]|nr:ribonuclease III [Gammaproteobacteria bacterium]
MSFNLDSLHKKLNYQFKNLSLIKLALTHRSAGKIHNERFEFLGDAILGLIVAEELFKLFPDATEGELSRMRASLVNRKVLAEIAVELDLGHYLQLGAGERKSGGKHRASILSDAVEAVIAAVYLDSGLMASNLLIKGIFKDRLQADAFPDQQKDNKTRLQEYLQARGLPLPKYTVSEIAGQAHDQSFKVDCAVVLMDEVQTGEGKSKRLAEQDAAKRILTQLENEP